MICTALRVPVVNGYTVEGREFHANENSAKAAKEHMVSNR